MEFKCVKLSGRHKTTWTGQIYKIKGIRENCEMDVIARGSHFHVIFGSHSSGNYLCIPNQNVGCELAHYSDIFWNCERLSRIIGYTDAITIATAVKEVSQILND